MFYVCSWGKKTWSSFLNIQDLLMKLEGFRYATSLDLTMGYYHITLCSISWILCTMVLSWVKFENSLCEFEISNDFGKCDVLAILISIWSSDTGIQKEIKKHIFQYIKNSKKNLWYCLDISNSNLVCCMFTKLDNIAL